MISLIVLYSVTAAGCLASLAAPFYGVLLYNGLAVLRPQQIWFWSLASSRLSFYAAAFALIGWIANKGKEAQPRWTVHHSLITLLWICTFISFSFADNKDVAQGKFESFCKIFLMFYPAMALVRTPNRIRMFLWMIVGIIGWFAFQENYNYFKTGQTIAARTLGLIGGDSNHYAVLFVIGTPLAHCLFLEEKDVRLKWLAFALMPLMIHCVFLTYSRGGILGVLLIAPFLFYHSRRQASAIIAFLVIGAVGIRLAGPSVVERFATIWTKGDEDGSIAQRKEAWKAASNMMQERPLTGVGVGCFGEAAHAFNNDLMEGRMAHNSYYEMGAEAGVVALASFLGLIAVSSVKAWKVRRRALQEGPEWAYHYAAGVEVSLLGCALCSFFLSNSGFELFYLLMTLAAALYEMTFYPAEAPVAVEDQIKRTRSYTPLPLYGRVEQA